MKRDHLEPGAAEFEAMAQAAVDALPLVFRAAAREVGVQVADYPSSDLQRELGIDDPLVLTGLYEGIPLTEKSVAGQPDAPDLIWLFRQPILSE